jgi:hypothetical protein
MKKFNFENQASNQNKRHIQILLAIQNTYTYAYVAAKVEKLSKINHMPREVELSDILFHLFCISLRFDRGARTFVIVNSDQHADVLLKIH